MSTRCQSSLQVSFTSTHPCGPPCILIVQGNLKYPGRQESGTVCKKGKQVGECRSTQIGQLGCAGSWIGLLQMPGKEFKGHKGDSVKAITCPKLPGQQA